MNLFNKCRDRKGLTIIEVLIASVTFLIGFSIMVFLLTHLIGNFSFREKVIAGGLARKYMETTLAGGEYDNLDKKEKVFHLTFRIERLVIEENGLNKIRINVYREKTDELLAGLYSEKFIK